MRQNSSQKICSHKDSLRFKWKLLLNQLFSSDTLPSPLTFRKKYSYLTSTNLYIMVTTDVTNAGRGATTNLLRMLQKIFHRFRQSQTKAFKHFGKVCSILFPFSLCNVYVATWLCNHISTLQRGKGRAKVFQGFWARIVVVSESLLSQSLSRSKAVQMQVLLFKRRKDIFLTIRNT